jgi:short-subunit dehydrogenase
MKKILILGGNSDIGIKIIDKLENNKNFILNVHYNNVFPKKKYSKKIKLIKKNFLYVNNENVKKIFDNNYDIIINLVGYVSSQSFLNFSLREIQKTILINSFVPFLIIRNSINI